LRSHVPEIVQAQAQRALHQTTDVKPPDRWIEVRDLKVIANIEVRIRHHHTADEQGNRGLAIEWVRPVNYEPSLNGALTRFRRVERGNHVIDSWRRRRATALGYHSGAGGRWIDIDPSCRRKRLHERADPTLVFGLNNHVEGMLASHDRLALDLDTVLPGVRHHHEAYSGRGYPDALKGDSIPLMARIIAVADSYDAMSSDRPYRKGLTIARLEEILKDGAGVQQCPAVSTTCGEMTSPVQPPANSMTAGSPVSTTPPTMGDWSSLASGPACSSVQAEVARARPMVEHTSQNARS